MAPKHARRSGLLVGVSWALACCAALVAVVGRGGSDGTAAAGYHRPVAPRQALLPPFPAVATPGSTTTTTTAAGNHAALLLMRAQERLVELQTQLEACAMQEDVRATLLAKVVYARPPEDEADEAEASTPPPPPSSAPHHHRTPPAPALVVVPYEDAATERLLPLLRRGRGGNLGAKLRAVELVRDDLGAPGVRLARARRAEHAPSTLHLAASAGAASRVLWSVARRYPGAAEARDGYGFAPLHRAAAEGQWGAVGGLLSAGADVFALTAGGATALHLAAHSRTTGVEEAVLLLSAATEARFRLALDAARAAAARGVFDAVLPLLPSPWTAGGAATFPRVAALPSAAAERRAVAAYALVRGAPTREEGLALFVAVHGGTGGEEGDEWLRRRVKVWEAHLRWWREEGGWRKG